MLIDTSIQSATAEQQLRQAQAAHAMLEELRVEPRKETLDVNSAQVRAAEASSKLAKETLEKTRVTFQTQQLLASVQLIEALGGGWDTGQMPGSKEVSATTAAHLP